MPTHFSKPAAESSFDVDFSGGSAGLRNHDLRGQGQLIVREAEPRFSFRGRPRKLFSIGAAPIEIALRSDEIANVLAEGTTVQFATPRGKSGAAKAPFVFACASPDYATAIAALLPPTKDAEFVAGENFMGRLRQLPGRGLGSITHLILLANAVVFIVMGFLGAGWVQVESMEPYIRFGANNAAATTDGEWWRLATCMFMHYGLVHLLVNAWALFQAGQFVERLFGRTLYTLVYFGSGLAGSVATLLWKGDQVWSAGASGAVFGVYGALLGYLLREKRGIPRGIFQPMLTGTLAFAGYNLFFGAGYNLVFGAGYPKIDNAAHLGGLIGGVVLGWLCALPLDHETRDRLRLQRAALAVAFTAVVVGVGVTFVPRFDYSVREERALQALNADARAKETPIMQHVFSATTALVAKRGAAEFSRRLETEGIPFYEDWRARLNRLQLAPDRRTMRQRDLWLRVIALKIESYRQHAVALEAGAPTAARNFDLARIKIHEEETRALNAR